MPKIYGEEYEPQQFLKLDREDDGSVKLHFVNESGEHMYGGNILRIDSDGKIHRYGSVSPVFNLKRNYVGEVLVEGIGEDSPYESPTDDEDDEG